MKLSVPIIIAFLCGALAMMIGWGDIVYLVTLAFGIAFLVVIGLVVWACVDKSKGH